VDIEAPKTRAQALAQDIERMISQRGLTEGDSLGTMDTWRDQTGYARSTVSEAMRLMIDRGSVEIRPGRGGGIFVAARNPVVRLRHTLLTVHGEPSTVADAISIREALESLVDTDAARYRTKQDITDLKVYLKKLTAATGDADGFMRANWALHERIAQITPNTMLRAVYTSMTSVISDLSDRAEQDESEADPHYLERRVEIHADLVEAIIAGDVDAAAAAVVRHSE